MMKFSNVRVSSDAMQASQRTKGCPMIHYHSQSPTPSAAEPQPK